MTDYRRNFIPGGSYFFTVAIADRSSSLLVDNVNLLRNALLSVKQEMPFRLDAMVVMPDHLHCVISLPPDDSDYPTRWKKIKARFSRGLPNVEARSKSRESKGERGIWQRRYWEHTLRDEQDMRNHIDYIHFNPVKHGYVTQVADWPYSTFHQYVRMGVCPKNWAGSMHEGEFGE